MLKDDANKIACRTNSLLGNYSLSINLRIDPTSMPYIIKSRQETFADVGSVYTNPSTIPEDDNYKFEASVSIIETTGLVRRFFLMSMHEDSQCLCAKIVNSLNSHKNYLNSNPVIKDLVAISKDDTVEDIMRRNEILDYIQNQDYQDQIK